jgi:hypothetical protein
MKLNGISMKQTAVEWLAEELKKGVFNNDVSFYDLIDKAKELEKQQIINAYDLGMGHYGGANRRSDAEQYYNETYETE